MKKQKKSIEVDVSGTLALPGDALLLKDKVVTMTVSGVVRALSLSDGADPKRAGFAAGSDHVKLVVEAVDVSVTEVI